MSSSIVEVEISFYRVHMNLPLDSVLRHMNPDNTMIFLLAVNI
jgi:hypothetical protein